MLGSGNISAKEMCWDWCARGSVIYRNPFWFTYTFQINSQATSINKQTNTTNVHFKSRMWSRRWPKTKWINHVAGCCAGRLHISIWLKCNYIYNLKDPFLFFTQSATFPSKVFWSWFDPNTTIKWSMKFQKDNRLWDLEREDCHASYSGKNKEPDALVIKLASQHNYRRLRAYRPTSNTVPQYQLSCSRTTYIHSPPDLLSDGRRRPVSLPTYQFLFI